MNIESIVLKNVSGSLFSANEASIGGAVFSSDTREDEMVFGACVFEENRATDGGALYLNAFGDVDIVTASYFRGNVAGESSASCGIGILKPANVTAHASKCCFPRC